MAKKNNPYYEDFISMINLSCEAGEYLKTTIENFDYATLSKKQEELHKIEHKADQVKHSLMKRLAKEFVTPIEREDIVLLASELDEVTDKIDDVLTRIYMYNIKTVRKETYEFVDIILRLCKTLQKVVIEFPNFSKSTTLLQTIIDVNTTEEEGDAIYIRSMRRLYEEEGNSPVEVFAWTQLFDQLEECCDACEHVADAIETIMMKNS